MTEQARQKQREYNRKWRAANIDKVRASRVRYWEKKAAEEAGKQESGGGLHGRRV